MKGPDKLACPLEMLVQTLGRSKSFLKQRHRETIGLSPLLAKVHITPSSALLPAYQLMSYGCSLTESQCDLFRTPPALGDLRNNIARSRIRNLRFPVRQDPQRLSKAGDVQNMLGGHEALRNQPLSRYRGQERRPGGGSDRLPVLLEVCHPARRPLHLNV